MITEWQGLTITRLCCCRSTANTGMIRETLLLTAKLLENFILRKIKIASLLDGMINSYQSHMHVNVFENLTHMRLVLRWALSNCLRPLWDSFHAFKIKITYTPYILMLTSTLEVTQKHASHPHKNTPSLWHDSSYCEKYGLCKRKSRGKKYNIRAQKHGKKEKEKRKRKIARILK